MHIILCHLHVYISSGKKLADLYMEIQNCSPSSELITQFEGALSSLMEDVKRLHEDNEKLENMFNRYNAQVLSLIQKCIIFI